MAALMKLLFLLNYYIFEIPVHISSNVCVA